MYNYDKNKFQKYSEIERKHIIELFEKIGITTYKMTDSSSMDKWDVNFSSNNGKLYMAEVKVRNFSSNDLMHTSYAFIEVAKLKTLLECSQNSNRRAVYINFTSDHKAIIYNLFKRYINEDGSINNDKIKRDTSTRLMNRQTASSTTDKIEKKVIELIYDAEIDKLIHEIKIEEEKPLYHLRELQIELTQNKTYRISVIKNSFEVYNLTEWLLSNRVVNTLDEAKEVSKQYQTINILNFFK